MARGRSQSSNLRFFSVAYYIRRPDRLIFIFLLIGAVMFFFWDRRGLVLQHEVDQVNNGKLNEEKAKLVEEVNQLKASLKRRTEELHFELDNDESREFDLDSKDDLAEDEADAIEETKHRAPVLNRVTLDGLKDAPADPNPIARERRDKVREAMIHAWSSYEKYAWGFDELMPVSKRGTNQFGGLGATIVDALDTLFIMGLHEQFEKATEWVATSLDFNKHYHASVFETTIRVLGGLLSSFDLSKNPMFLTKAQELADRLLPAWNTATGIPLNTIELASGNANNPSWTGGSSVLADLATEQVELIGLSQRTGIPKYKEKAENVIRKLQEIMPSDGLLPIYISPHSGQPTTQKITFGAMGDSFYEYLLKVWMLGNKTHVVQHYRDMWEHSMEGMISLVKKSSPSSYLYIAERSGNILQDKMDELACFAPGMLALGMDGANPQKARQYLEIAEGLAETCYNFYMTTPTKLAGENYHFRDGEDMVVGASYNILRPETIESLFYLWRRTGNAKYRDWGWDIFQAFETRSRIPTGYVGLHDVQSGVKDDMMQSFFLAETLKYLYLLFSPTTVIPLDEWVFNTEAHPIRIMTRLEDTMDGETQEGRESHLRDDIHGRDANHLRGEIGGKAQLNRFDRNTGQRKYIRKGSTKGTGPFDYR